MKKILPVLLLLLIVLAGGCSIDFGRESIILPTELYVSSNGYEVMLPTAWTKEEPSVERVEFSSEDKQLAGSITTELGGIDYYSMREIKEQFTTEIGEELFSDYSVDDNDSHGTKYFRTLLKGTSKEGTKIAVDIYAYQPYLTMRHYMVIVTSADLYDQYKDLIGKMVDSFTNTKTEDQYLQLMQDRREAAAEDERKAADEAANPAANGDKGNADDPIAPTE